MIGFNDRIPVILKNVSILDNELIIIIAQGTAYNVSVQLNHVSVNGINNCECIWISFYSYYQHNKQQC